MAGASTGGAFAGGGGSAAQLFRAEVGRGSQAHQHQQAGRLAEQINAQAFTRFALEAALFEAIGHGGAEALEQLAAAGLTGFAAEQAHRQRFAAPAGNGGGAATDVGDHLGGSDGGDGRAISRARR